MFIHAIVILSIIIVSNGEPRPCGKNKRDFATCGCYHGRCWTFTDNPPVSNGNWCYTQEIGISQPLKKWKTCVKNYQCDFNMTCGSSIRYKGGDRIVKDEDDILQCPDGWIKYKKKTQCYFLGNKFTGLSWFTASEFCYAIKGRLAEIRDHDDFEALTAAVKTTKWTGNPWIGIIRPLKDVPGWIPASGGEMPTMAYNDFLNEQTVNNSRGDCGGFSKDGESFGFYTCNAEIGSPICELDYASVLVF